MSIKKENGLSVIDIIVSVIVITIFITMIGNLIVNINLNSKNAERKTVATSYAVQEIERIKAMGYIEEYNDKGIADKDIIKEEDIMDDGNFTGYHKKITIKDYVYIKNDNTKQKNLLKEVTVEISYKLGNQNKNVTLSTYITFKKL